MECMVNAVFLREVQFQDWPEDTRVYPYNIPAFRGLAKLSFERPVTFCVGENGSGKSTLLEAIAIRAGFNPEGGGRHNVFANANTESPLHRHIRLSWLPKVTRGFFLRAESFFNFASHIDELERECPTGYAAYGGKSLHEQSHGESFLSLFTHRFRSRGKALYLLDEPEAALPLHVNWHCFESCGSTSKAGKLNLSLPRIPPFCWVIREPRS